MVSAVLSKVRLKEMIMNKKILIGGLIFILLFGILFVNSVNNDSKISPDVYTSLENSNQTAIIVEFNVSVVQKGPGYIISKSNKEITYEHAHGSI